ncbi:MAG: deoxyribodipyrimidine photo-lyase [Proteobacteria bacterium]|nr:deoxyribodipyrimidine photo-lyase [Pseudomonadota bacterium]
MTTSAAAMHSSATHRVHDGTALVWLRRDLRLSDHAALHHALRDARRVALAFVFDTDILQPLLDRGAHADRRLAFIHASLAEIDEALRQMGSSLLVEHGRAAECIPRLAAKIHAQVVYANRDYEPQAVQRDAEVAGRLAGLGLEFHTFCDHVMVDPLAVLTGKGRPYSVFTPYKNAWFNHVRDRGLADLAALECNGLSERILSLGQAPTLPALTDIGFDPRAALPHGLPTGSSGAQTMFADFLRRIDAYADARDYPAAKGPSYLSVHLRFGTISVRELAREAWRRMQAGSNGAAIWLSELVWREFYVQILHHYPQVVAHAFKPEYDKLQWDDDPELFVAWSEGRTGYPLVDAAMRQLNATGYMHNRLRMVTASFLVKDLGLDWRRGERYFALKLNDFDLAANNGGWQWVASTGCDAQPYFRIFNPIAQSKKFDSDGRFIRRYVPELAGLSDACIHAPWQAKPLLLQKAGVRLGTDYPTPVVDHSRARERTLKRYAAVSRRDNAEA